MRYLMIMVVLVGLFACSDSPKNTKIIEEPKDSVRATLPLYIGTYTKKEGHVDGKAAGIYLMEMNPEDGHLKLKSVVAELTNPSFVATSLDGKNLYAVSELSPADDSTGYIYAYAINEDNGLNFLHRLPTDGFAPCHISFDKTGKFVFVTNYVGGVVKMYERDAEGILKSTDMLHLETTDASKQVSSHPHSTMTSPDNNFVFIADLGSNKIWNFKINHENGTLSPNTQPFIEIQAGAGPRHFTFHPNGKFAYVINELDNTVNAFSYDTSKSSLTDLQSVSTLPANFKGDSYCADVHIHPNGKFLYGSNRGHDSIVAFMIGENGTLDLIGHYPAKGGFPRNFSIDPSGKYLYVANQNSDNIVQYNIDQNSGTLTFSESIVAVKTPVCITWKKK